MHSIQLTRFTQPEVLQQIGRRVLLRFFERFAPELKSVHPPFPPPSEDLYSVGWANRLNDTDTLPVALVQALRDIEQLAAPENRSRLLAAIDQTYHSLNLDPADSPERNALLLWLHQSSAPPRRLDPPTAPAADPPNPPSATLHSSVSTPHPEQPVSGTLHSSLSTLHPEDRPAEANTSTTSQPAAGQAPAPSDSCPPSAAFDQLARLPAAQYDRLRRAEAKRLGLRLKTLDAEVEYRRCQMADSIAHATLLPALEPWPEPIRNAPELFDQVSGRFTMHIFLPPGAADTLALFAGHVPAINAFHQSPRLNLFSTEGGCGKTTTLDLLHPMLPRPLRAENLSPAVLFRLIHQQQPTFFLDECDTWLTKDPELRGLLNAGHKAGAHAYRCEGPRGSIRAFKAFAPTILAGIRPLPPTLRDRSITITLTKAPAGSYTRFNPLHTEFEIDLGRKLARWAQDNFAALQASDPPLPAAASNRLADNWRPLFAVAQIIGGDWPARAARAFDLLNPRPSIANDPDLALLADVRLVFARTGAQRLLCSAILDALRALPDRPWAGTASTPPLTKNRLGRHLSNLGVRARAITIGGKRAKGYDLSDLAPTLARLQPPPAPAPNS